MVGIRSHCITDYSEFDKALLAKVLKLEEVVTDKLSVFLDHEYM